ncbi:VPLPA-CTERM protein sorting domain-containing protein/choice-of-anchor C domain-containing protein [Syntrophus gentianae]|uniref:VPLPA-CTERM protein sorting domain-containing protein/choice-of-anchor C domain-containing protein n=1 Tax=Syntrophus gentianae TaxID=43775 RepID=A0A1H8BK79_9BACT|nr:DUF642 domain-containing protein [Syntrophus gentianae]SEM82869.1 VPLPA-CTERM protein sorting domain-containing protein/choice-of-anchor C domain-containing protein [Syntrophus gentianae]
MKKLFLLALVALACIAPSLSFANLVVNGSFETGFSNWAGPVWATYSFTGWTVTKGSIDVSYAPSGNWWQAADGQFSLDMNGSSVGEIRSDAFSTTPGQTYIVHFAMAGNPSGQYGKTMTMDVSVNGDTPQTFSHLVTEPSYYAGMPLSWENMSFTFVADADWSYLTFTSTYTGSQYQGPTLDSVRVDAVPLPASLLLFAPGLLGLAGLRRKFSK